MAKDWRIGGRDFGRREENDPLIRKSIIERNPGTTQFFWDRSVPGFGLKITNKEHRSYVYQFRTPERRHPVRITFKDVSSVVQARALAAQKAAEKHSEAAERPSTNPETLAEVVAAYLAFRGPAYKSRVEFERSLRNHVLPTLGDRPYESITKPDLARLKHAISTKAGPHAAHTALKNLNTVWSKYYEEFASDGYVWPRVRSPIKDTPTNGNGRKLSDREIREIWQATFQLPPNKGAYIRFLFLSGMRRTFAARITRDQLVGDVLHIPGSATKPPYELPLSGPALELLNKHWGKTWAFESLGPFHPLKQALDKQLSQVAPWRIHDIRHCVRSLLSRVTTPDTAERALGHALTGMRRVYDHHDYTGEVRTAMNALATLLAEITK